MASNRLGIRAERDKRVTAILTFAQSLPPRLKTNSQDPTLTAELQSHLVTFPLTAPSSHRGEFDSVATDLWNLSTRLLRNRDEHSSHGTTDKQQLCLLRVFTCFLLDCAQEHIATDKSGVWANGIRILKVILKAAKTCITNSETDWGTKMLEKAATYVTELAMREETSITPEDRTILERLRNEFLVMRVMLAWKQQKLDVADHMFNQIEIDKLMLDSVAVEGLSDVLYEIGRDEFSKKHLDMAIHWFERALNILGDQQLEYLTDTAPDLKLSTLHLLIKSLVDTRNPESFAKAQSLMELMDAEFGDKMLVSLLKLEIFSMDPKPEPGVYHGVLLRLFRSIHLSRPNFKTIMHHLHKLRNLDPIEACRAIDDFLRIRLFEQDKEEYVERAAVMRIWITTTSSDSSSMSKSLEEFLNLLSKNSKGPFSSAATHAAQTLLWKIIEADISQKRYESAETLCRLANHSVFSKCGEGNKAKLARKVMICALARNDLSVARESFFSMPEAARLNPQSRFLLYKVALRSQDDDLGRYMNKVRMEPTSLNSCVAKESLDIVSQDSTKNSSLLYACVLEAQQLGRKEHAIQALERVLQKYKYNVAPGVHLPALLRCLAKLIKSDIDGKTNFESEGIENFCKVFESAAAQSGKSRAAKEVSSAFDKSEMEWFCRNSYNFALEYCSNLHPSHLSRLALSSIKFIDMLTQLSDLSKEDILNLQFRQILCEYLVLVANIVLARASDNIEISNHQYVVARRHAITLREIIPIYIESRSLEDGALKDLKSRHYEVVKYELEAVIRLQKWDDIDVLFRACWRYETDRKWDTLADLGFIINEESQKAGVKTVHQERVLSFIQQVIQHASSHSENPNILARWLRCLFQISLPSSGKIAAQCIVQAISLSNRLKETKTPFPATELEWLAASSFNHAIDLYSAGDDANARMWAEKALMLAEMVENDGSLALLLQEKYALLTWRKDEGTARGELQ